MKERIKKMLLRKFKISYDTTEELFGENLLSEKGCKKFLIKSEYHSLISENERDTVMVELAEKYFVSTSTVWNFVYR